MTQGRSRAHRTAGASGNFSFQHLRSRGSACCSALLTPRLAFVREISRIRAESTARPFLYYRLRNLAGREYGARVGEKYELTAVGISWLKLSSFAQRRTAAPDEMRRPWISFNLSGTPSCLRSASVWRQWSPTPLSNSSVACLRNGHTDFEVTTLSADMGTEDVMGAADPTVAED